MQKKFSKQKQNSKNEVISTQQVLLRNVFGKFTIDPRMLNIASEKNKCQRVLTL